jgi:predicted DNA-binding mobile mystery protein A
MEKQQLMLRQLDSQLQEWNVLKAQNIPPKGWIATLRKALGMTAEQLGKRLKLSRTRIVKLEQAEVRGATTLRSLKQAAEALDCDLVYALVPRTSLSDTLKKQAIKKAKKMVSQVSHSMKLEDQGIDEKETEIQLKETVESLLFGSLKHLWDE